MSSPRKKAASPKETDRQRREAERRERDAERARKRRAKQMEIKQTIAQRKQMKMETRGPIFNDLDDETSIKMRKKILGYRRDRARTLAAKEEFEEKDNDDPEPEPPQEAVEPSDPPPPEEAQEAAPDDESQDTVPRVMVTSVSSDSPYLALGEASEVRLYGLEQAFLAADPKFFGSLGEDAFVEAFETSKRPLDLTIDERKHLYRRCLVPGDDGIDYYQFLMIVRVQALTDGGELIDILRQMALQQASNEDGMESDDDDDSIGARPDFGAHARQTSVISFTSVRNLDPENPLAQLIDDLALDGADIDLALIKTAFQMIDVNPNDDDLEVIFNYLDTDGTGWVDFRYFLQFLQEAHNVEAAQFDLESAITAVAGQLRIFLRDQARREAADAKLKARLERRRLTKQPDTLAEDLASLQKEEKLEAARIRREKAKGIR